MLSSSLTHSSSPCFSTLRRLITRASAVPAGARCAAAEPHGADGEDLGEEQEEAPQGRRKHQEEAVRAGLQHVQRLVQRVRALVSQHGYADLVDPSHTFID